MATARTETLSAGLTSRIKCWATARSTWFVLRVGSTHLDALWEDSGYRRFARLSQICRLVTFDEGGSV